MDKHYIVLNGKRYDAVTGALLGPDTTVAAQPVKHRRQAAAQAVHNRHAATKPSVISPTKAIDTTFIPPAKKTSTNRPQHHPKNIRVVAHKPQPAKTLMRHAVKKPGTANHVPVKRQYPIVKTASGITVQAPKRLAHNVDETRVKRAQQIHKSTHVGRFHAPAVGPIKAHVAPLAVAEPKKQIPVVEHTTKPTAKPARKIDVFEAAIASAQSHQEPAPKGLSKRRRVVNASAAVATFLVLGGFIAALNQSSLEMQLASARAGFKAQIPSYAPDGFEQNSATVAGKAVVLKYASPNGTYTLTQESSNWDSQTLFDSITMAAGSQYQVLQHQGRVIYLYNGTEAAWVNGGILYKLNGTARLTPDQIIDIATSL